MVTESSPGAGRNGESRSRKVEQEGDQSWKPGDGRREKIQGAFLALRAQGAGTSGGHGKERKASGVITRRSQDRRTSRRPREPCQGAPLGNLRAQGRDARVLRCSREGTRSARNQDDVRPLGSSAVPGPFWGKVPSSLKFSPSQTWSSMRVGQGASRLAPCPEAGHASSGCQRGGGGPLAGSQPVPFAGSSWWEG